MLISRQGAGGDRAHTHGPWGEYRMGASNATSASLTRGTLSSRGLCRQTTFRCPGACAEIDKEVAL